jgi:hypothetical protein
MPRTGNADSLNRRAKIISSLGKIYFCDYYIDLASGRLTELDAEERLKEFTRGRDDAAGLLADSCRTFAAAEHVGSFLEFTDLSHAEGTAEREAEHLVRILRQKSRAGAAQFLSSWTGTRPEPYPE